MVRALGETAYWAGFFGSAVAAALGIWALMNFPIMEPEKFALMVGSRTLFAFAIGYAVREFARRMG